MRTSRVREPCVLSGVAGQAQAEPGRPVSVAGLAASRSGPRKRPVVLASGSPSSPRGAGHLPASLHVPTAPEAAPAAWQGQAAEARGQRRGRSPSWSLTLASPSKALWAPVKMIPLLSSMEMGFRVLLGSENTSLNRASNPSALKSHRGHVSTLQLCS